MLVQNEQEQLLTISAYAEQLLREGLGGETVTEADAQNALGELFLVNYQEQSQLFLNQPAGFTALTLHDVNLFIPWRKLKEAFCEILKGDDILGHIIEWVIEAILTVIGGGKFIATLVKKIVKYFMGIGSEAMCK
ncbi:hypothetical protein [Flavobacterium sp. JP2137]|uniref:hypothetical protein n=1 Tax=Flavobacterium sp. JP2137 TaxID=3414510 RepID=UPI003D2FDD83